MCAVSLGYGGTLEITMVWNDMDGFLSCSKHIDIRGGKGNKEGRGEGKQKGGKLSYKLGEHICNIHRTPNIKKEKTTE